MLRRLSCLALALAFAASSVFSAAAWSADSFISGGPEYEPDVSAVDDLPLADVYVAPRRARMVKVSAADQAAVDANTTGKLVVPATLPTSVDGTFQVMSKYYNYQPAQSTPPLPKFEADYWRDVVATFSAASPLFSSGWLHLFAGTLIYNADVSDSYEMVRGLAVFCDKDKAIFPKGNYITGAIADVGSDSWSFTVNYDVSSFSSSAFSLDGLSSYCIIVNGPYTSDNYVAVYSSSVSVLVDGQQVLTLSRGPSNFIDFGGYVFSGASNISTISFRWTMPFWSFVSDSPSYNGSYIFAIREDILKILDIIEATGDSESRIVDNLKFDSILWFWAGSRTLTFIPAWTKYFNTFAAPELGHKDFPVIPAYGLALPLDDDEEEL
jgi:hypothetical protein